MCPRGCPSGAGWECRGAGWECRGSSAPRAAGWQLQRDVTAGFACSRRCRGSPRGCPGATLIWEHHTATQTPCPECHSRSLPLPCGTSHRAAIHWGVSPCRKEVRWEDARGLSHLLSHPHVPQLPAAATACELARVTKQLSHHHSHSICAAQGLPAAAECSSNPGLHSSSW